MNSIASKYGKLIGVNKFLESKNKDLQHENDTLKEKIKLLLENKDKHFKNHE